jgi:hypothetical protein
VCHRGFVVIPPAPGKVALGIGHILLSVLSKAFGQAVTLEPGINPVLTQVGHAAGGVLPQALPQLKEVAASQVVFSLGVNVNLGHRLPSYPVAGYNE